LDVIVIVEGKGFLKVLARAYKKLRDFLGKDVTNLQYKVVGLEETGNGIWRVQFVLEHRQTKEDISNYIANLLVKSK